MDTLCKKQLKVAINNLQQQEIEYGGFFTNLYVERKNSYKIQEVLSLFELLNDNITILFSGQPGCGKTTELHLLKELLEQTSERKTSVIFISLFLDGIYAKKLEYTDIILGIFSEFLIQISNKIDFPKEIISDLAILLKELDNERELKKFKNTVDFIFNGYFHIFKIKMNKSDQIREKFRLLVERKLAKILSIFDNILERLQNDSKVNRIVIIVDDLEKIVDEHVIINFLYEHGNLIKERKCSFIITINNNIHYDSRGEYALTQFNASYRLSFMAIKKRDGSYDKNEINKVKEIIRKRVPKDLIDEKALELAIIYSGGNLSILFRIYGTAINKVNFKEKCKITVEFVEDAFYDVRYRDSYLNKNQLITLRKIHTSKGDYRMELSPDELKNHLNNCALLTYRDIKNHNLEWYVLNPAFFYEEELRNIEKNTKN